jgi:sulfide:quinone oxidoreductase
VKRVVIAGAGFGGIAAAVALRRTVPATELEVVLVDRRAEFVMGLRKTWAVLGIAGIEEGRRPLARLVGIEFVQAEIDRVDPARRSITAAGRDLTGDALVIAMGATHALDAVPGLADNAINVWDSRQAERAHAALTSERPRHLAIGIFGMPYACPPGPFELALLARDRLGSDVAITMFGPAPIALPVLGPVESAKLERMLEQAGIAYLRPRQAVGVEAGRVIFGDGSELTFDALFAVPPHRCPPVLVESGLAAEGGWVKPDAQTLETAHPGVYAVGDSTVVTLANGLALPKAGVIAAAQGEVVAARIAAALSGSAPAATYGGTAFCYVEAGAGRAAMASGDFYAQPVPAVAISEPTVEQLEHKREFERSYLAAWFGG